MQDDRWCHVCVCNLVLLYDLAEGRESEGEWNDDFDAEMDWDVDQTLKTCLRSGLAVVIRQDPDVMYRRYDTEVAHSKSYPFHSSIPLLLVIYPRLQRMRP